MAPRPTSLGRWWLPAAFIVQSAIPLVAGAIRVASLAGGAKITPENARFFESPLPVVAHIASVTLFCILGSFQFVPWFRRKAPHWHRNAGRLLIACALVGGVSGLWMTQFYPPAPADGAVLYALRVAFGGAMILCVGLGFSAIRRRDVARHGAWMSRGYAIALGAGTQAIVHIPWILLLGPPGVSARASLMGTGWIVNLMIAEWIIRRRSAVPLGTAATA